MVQGWGTASTLVQSNSVTLAQFAHRYASAAVRSRRLGFLGPGAK